MDRGAWIVGLVALVCACRPAAPPEPSVGVGLKDVDEQQFAAALAEQRGKVILVDFWATWGPPCRALFPHTVDLHRRYADRGLAVMTVSLDNPAEESNVLRFLDAQRATTANFLSRYGTGTKSVEAFQIGRGAIPYLKLYDRQGQLSKIFGLGGDELDLERIEQAINQLLTSPGT